MFIKYNEILPDSLFWKSKAKNNTFQDIGNTQPVVLSLTVNYSIK